MKSQSDLKLGLSVTNSERQAEFRLAQLISGDLTVHVLDSRVKGHSEITWVYLFNVMLIRVLDGVTQMHFLSTSAMFSAQ